MSFSDNQMYIPNPLVTSANSIAEEATTSGAGKVEYHVPHNLDVEGFGALVAVTLGNTITTATGIALCRVVAGVETVLEILKLSNNSNGLYAGDGTSHRGGSVVAATTFAFVAGDMIMKKMTGCHHFPAGSIIRMRGTTTVGSAVGDLVPFVVARLAGTGYKLANVYQEGVLTRNA